MSIVLLILGMLLFLADRLFTAFSRAELMTEQGSTWRAPCMARSLSRARPALFSASSSSPRSPSGAASRPTATRVPPPFARPPRTRYHSPRLRLRQAGEYSRVFVSHAQFWTTTSTSAATRYVSPGALHPRRLSQFDAPSPLGLTSLFLLGALSALRGPGAPPLPRRERIFWSLLGIGFIYLALDEIFMFHEFIGANLHFDDGGSFSAISG